MGGLVKNYAIDWKTYDGTYIMMMEMRLKVMHDKINKINKLFKEFVMVKNVWYDDHAADFVKWFRKVAVPQQYTTMYKGAIYLFYITVKNTCSILKQAQPNAYLNYARIKSYANSDMWDVLGANYKNLNTASTFTAAQEKVKVGEISKGDQAKVNAAVKNLYAEMNSLTETVDAYCKMVLGFGVGNFGVKLQDFEGGVAASQARDVANNELNDKKVFKAQLEQALSKSNMITKLKNN